MKQLANVESGYSLLSNISRSRQSKRLSREPSQGQPGVKSGTAAKVSWLSAALFQERKCGH